MPDRSKAAGLDRGVARTREGIRMLRAAIETIAGSFGLDGSSVPSGDGLDRSRFGKAPAAAARINSGMQPLWKLAG